MCDRHFSLSEALYFPSAILSKNADRYKIGKIKIGFDSGTNNGMTFYDSFHPVGSFGSKPMTVYIGTKSLSSNTVNNMVSDRDFVWLIQQSYHESMHIWQYGVGYRRFDADPVTKSAARDFVIGSFIPEYSYSSYAFNISELQAEQFSVEQTKRFFGLMSEVDGRFSDIDVDLILCEHERSRYGAIFPRLYSVDTADLVASVFSMVAISSVYQHKFPVLQIENAVLEEKRSSGFKEVLQNEKLCDSIINSPSGLEETELLCHYIGEHHPEHFRGLLCVRDEYCHDVGSKAISKLLRVIEAKPVEPGPDGPEIL